MGHSRGPATQPVRQYNKGCVGRGHGAEDGVEPFGASHRSVAEGFLNASQQRLVDAWSSGQDRRTFDIERARGELFKRTLASVTRGCIATI